MIKKLFFIFLLQFSFQLTAQICFMENPEIDLLGLTRQMHITDIDGDTQEDLLVAGSIGIQKCSGNNTLNFGSPDTLIYCNDSYSFGTGDIDLDGDIDIVVGTQDSVITYIQSSTNIFIRIDAFPVVPGEVASCIVLADISGDGLRDLMWSSIFGPDFHVKLNTGSGIWAAITTYAGLGLQCEDFVVTDLDNDAQLDVAATSHGIAVFWNLGGGIFSIATPAWSNNGYTSSVVACDLDNDGFLDLVAGSHFGSNFAVNDITVIKNNGGMQFQYMSDYEGGGSINSIAITDINGDGLWDVATADRFSGTVSCLIASSTFVFDKLIQYNSDGNVDIESDDYDNDSDYDLITINNGLASILENDSNKRLIAQTRFPTYHMFNFDPDFKHIEVKDVDGDTRPEIIIAGDFILLMKDTGYKNFAPWTWYFPRERVEGMRVGDMNGDGDVDLIYSNFLEDSVYLRLNNGVGIFGTELSFYVGPYVGSFCIDDMDHDGDLDGDLDIIVPRHSLNKISIMYNDGTGYFPTIQDITFANNPGPLETGDLNGDSLPEMIVGHTSLASVKVLTNLGSGNFSSQTYTVSTAPTIIKVADTDHDGDNDFAVFGVGSNTKIFKNSGAVFTPFSTNLGGGVIAEIQFGDLTGDSLPEMIGVSTLGVIKVHVNFGNDSFAFDQNTGPGIYTYDVVIADFDNDNDNDILAPTDVYGGVSVNENCDTTLYAPPASPSGIASHANIFNEISIQPNPFSNETVVVVSHFGHPNQIKLFDIAGKEVTSLFRINLTENSDTSFEVHLTGVSVKPGTYFLQLSNAEGDFSIGKLMIVE